MKPPSLSQLFKDHSFIAGVDEAGRGPLAGPVVAASVVIQEQDLPLLEKINPQDSKQLSPLKRVILMQQITATFPVAVGVISASTIDKINIYQATLLAMQKSLEKLAPKPSLVLIDGSATIKNLPQDQLAIPKADRFIPLVSAASIVAKVIRDQILVHYHQLLPNYHFKKHKGYGTPQHLEALERFGPSPFHRQSFKFKRLSR